MAKARKIAGTVADATLPKTPIEIGGKMYNLCLDFGALAEAEIRINAELMRGGSDLTVNLLNAFGEVNLSNSMVLLAAALRKFHPEISYDAACKLINATNVISVSIAVQRAYRASMPDAPANPS